MEALRIVVVSGFPRRNELESTCLTLANACREGARCSLLMAALSPPSLLRSLMPEFGQGGSGIGGEGRRSTTPPVASRISRHGMVRRLRIEGNFDLRLVHWPGGLTEVVFAGEFNQGLRGVRWPSGVVKLESVGVFDMPLHHPVTSLLPYEESVLPPNLKELVLGGNFNRNIDKVYFPPTLESIKLGSAEDGFLDSDDEDGEAAAVAGESVGSRNDDDDDYPDEPSFNRPILKATWPTNLKRLEFGSRFNKPVEGAKFPDSLEEISFGTRFDQPIVGVKWPAELRRLRLGEDFYQDLKEVFWPGKLEEIIFWGDLDYPILSVEDVMDVVWPDSMRKLIFSWAGRSIVHTCLVGDSGR